MKTVLIDKKTGVTYTQYDDKVAANNFLDGLGDGKVLRASHIILENDGTYTADMTSINGPVLRGFATREEAVEEEEKRINADPVKMVGMKWESAMQRKDGEVIRL